MADGPKGDLASRLKARGLNLPSGSFSAHAAVELASTTAHKALSVSAAEKKQLFTPLAQQGNAAVQAEKRRKTEAEDELLSGVKTTLRKWVQECLARDDKRQRFLEKGVMKCRVQAAWSEGLHERLQGLIAGYGGKLAADGDKENHTRVKWIQTNEKWLVAFDAAAFERFMAAHPEVIDPSDTKLRCFLDDYAGAGGELNSLDEALAKKFGPLRPATVSRARHLLEEVSAKGRKSAKRPRLQEASAGNGELAAMRTVEDVAWAVGLLVPLGLRPEGVEPVLRSPSAVALPTLQALGALTQRKELRELLRATQVGKVVSALRHHPSSDVAAAAKELLAAWKSACASKGAAGAAA